MHVSSGREFTGLTADLGTRPSLGSDSTEMSSAGRPACHWYSPGTGTPRP
ncbi:hypothetical protein T261_0965 [Streptomyces lydicus]|nr:hypothetical protein T261_0965 [Streptomyces lydicus]